MILPSDNFAIQHTIEEDFSTQAIENHVSDGKIDLIIDLLDQKNPDY